MKKFSTIIKVGFNRVLIRFISSKAHSVLPQFVKEALIGILLGDGYAERSLPTRNTRIQLIGGLVNKPYLVHLYDLLAEFCKADFKEGKSWNKKNSHWTFWIKFWTCSLPCFNEFHSYFYVGKIKILPINLFELLTPVGLAYWAMDDGFNTPNGFYFCTESFTIEENNRLKDILEAKFNIKSGVHKTTNGPRLYIHKESKELFFSLIRPYIIPHFNFKIGK